MTGLWPEGGGGGFAADYKKASSRPPSFRPKRSGVEKSPSSDCTGSITVGDLSTQSIIGAVTVCPIPARSHAQDDGGGERPSRHFDRSGAEWRNLLPLMVRAALRREISRLRVSSERLPSAPYRHAAPLEMTKEPRHPTVMLKKGMRLAPESLAVRMQKKRSPSFRGASFYLRSD